MVQRQRVLEKYTLRCPLKSFIIFKQSMEKDTEDEDSRDKGYNEKSKVSQKPYLNTYRKALAHIIIYF